MATDFFRRQSRLHEKMKEKNISSLIVSDRKDIYYHTGFMNLEGDFAFLVFRKPEETPTLFLSSLSNHAEGIKTAHVEFVDKLSVMEKFLDGSEIVGYDENDLIVSVFRKLSSYLKKARLDPCSDLIRSQRSIKGEEELKNIRKASGITENVMSTVKSYMEGEKENALSHLIEIEILRNSVRKSFDNIVASGKNSAFIHYIPSNEIIRPKDLVVVDMGVVSRNYCSDMSRTFCIKPRKREKELRENVSGIQEILIDNIHDGVPVKNVTELYEREMNRNGYKILHRWGHGIGLNVHEELEDILRKGMVITVEPGAYIRGFGGCRIEDMVLVGKNKSKKLTKLSSGF